MFQPLEQFNIYLLHELSLAGFSFSLTNYWLVGLYLLIATAIFVVWPLKYIPLVPTNWVILLEGVYNFLVKLFSQHVNNFHSLYYFPIISTIFFTVLFSNLLGLMPYNFTLTSHIFTTLTMSLTMFVGTIVISLYYNKLNYFKFFVPKGIDNKPLKYFLVFIEIISYIIRPFSLAIRLFANMLAGHTLLYILNTFLVYVTSKKWFLVFILPFVVIFMVFILEFAIAFIQAYVFTTLLVIYINDIYNVSH
jgi:ATP synthase subunit 6